MSFPPDFNRLEVLTRIEGTLVNHTPLRIGFGREASPLTSIDIGVIRIRRADGREVPYIPGSSLKGAMRSLAERLLRAQNTEVHSPWDFKKMEEEKKSKKYCLLCSIFGNTGIASHVTIYDAYPLSEAITQVRTCVGINREFGGAQPDVLYREEFVAPGTHWSFKMDIVNIRVYPKVGDQRGELVKQLIQALQDGHVQVGARKTVGYGLIQLVKAGYKVYEPKNGRLEVTTSGEL
uniref:CRISPR-associated RAMP protein n=1 Tax=Thermosphaera aggregans TaxID=54254 RepID=A0A7C2FZ16_9CREN